MLWSILDASYFEKQSAFNRGGFERLTGPSGYKLPKLASPEEMERLVTERIEATLSLVSGVDEISSESGEGATRVRVRFTWGTDLDAAANDVRDRLDRITDELPEDMPRPQLQKFDISSSPIVLLGLGEPDAACRADEGAEAQAPSARAVVGGLTVSTLVTLVLIPAIYTLVHPERRATP